MSDKKLLNESTIRRFMTLANMENLSGNFIAEQYDDDEEPLEEEAEEEEIVEEEELPPAPEDDEMQDDEMQDDEMEMDMGDLEPDPDTDMDVAEDVQMTQDEAMAIASLGRKISAALGEEEELEAPDEEVAPEEEAALQSLEGEEAVSDEGGMSPEEEVPAAMQEHLIKEVLKRVTKRIIREKMNR